MKSDKQQVDPPGHIERIRAAWVHMLGDSDDLADGITAAILEKDQGLGWSSGELRAVLRLSTREHVRKGLSQLAGVADREGRNPRMLEVWRATGIERARQGVPLESVLSAYATGNLLLWEAMTARVKEGRLDVTPEELVAAGQQLWHDLGVQGEIMGEAYRRETARLELRDLRRQENCLAGLLEGRGADPSFAEQAQEILGIRSEKPLACVVAILEDAHSEPLRHPEDQVQRRGGTSRWGVRDGALYGIVSLDGRDEAWLSAALRPVARGRVGLAVARRGMADAASAFRFAERAAATVPSGGQDLVWASARLPELLVSTNAELGSMIIDEVLGGLLALPEAQSATLLETLRALLRHGGSATHAAESLFCHRNTVIYRSRQLGELTGCDMQDPRGRLLLELAILAYDLSARTPRQRQLPATGPGGS